MIKNFFHTMSLCTTLSWKDRRRNILITKAHKAVLTTESQFVKMRVGDTSLRDFVLCCKSSLQSDVGSTSRRSKLGAERLSIGYNRCLTKVTHVKCTNH